LGADVICEQSSSSFNYFTSSKGYSFAREQSLATFIWILSSVGGFFIPESDKNYLG